MRERERERDSEREREGAHTHTEKCILISQKGRPSPRGTIKPN